MKNKQIPPELSNQGLTSAEVAAATAEGRVNVANEKTGKSYLRIIFDNLFTFFNLLWALIAVLMILLGSYTNLTFLFIIIPNALIAIIQECRAKATVEKLSVTTDPRAVVLRDGVLTQIPAEQIVPGDVMCIGMGQQVLSDAQVIYGLAEANESMLTGESDAIRKEPGASLLAGSYLVSGEVYAKVVHVGKDNYVHKIESAAKSFRAPASNLFNDLNRLLRIISFILVPTAAVIFLTDFFTKHDLVSSILYASGSIIGMIPAGMYLLVTVTLTLSVITLAKKRTLVQDMYAIEMLASADVVCLDKTGTITDGTMTVSDLIPLGAVGEEQIRRIMALIEGSERNINATSKALIAAFGTADDDAVTEKIPFSSARKYSAVAFATAGAYALGAPHFVPCPICEETEGLIKRYAAEGKRVLILSSHTSLSEEGTPLALIAVADCIRPNAKETIAKFQEQGVSVKIISGDHPATVSSIAGRVGVKHYEKYLSCEDLTDEQLQAAAEDYAVFGRVSPEQKVLLVKRLKALGHTVAMTGDGVNDTLALKESNCAIAMADGSEMARKVSKIVLMDSDFGTLPDVVREGRRCINNVRRSSSLFLMKTAMAIFLSVFSGVCGVIALITQGAHVMQYPFQAKDLVLLEMFVIGISSVLLAVEPNNERIEGSFIRTVLKNSLPNAIAMIVPAIFIMILGAVGFFASPAQRTIFAIIAVTAAGYVNLVVLSLPFTRWRAMVVGVMSAALAIAIPTTIFLPIPMLKDMFGFLQVGDKVAAALLVAAGSMLFSVIVHLCRILYCKLRRQDREAKAS